MSPVVGWQSDSIKLNLYYHQKLCACFRQTTDVLCLETCFSNDIRHSNWYQLCPYFRRIVYKFINTGASQNKRKEVNTTVCFHVRYSKFGDCVDHICPVELDFTTKEMISVSHYEHSNSTCIWSIYFLENTIFKSLYCDQDFLDSGFLITMNVLNQRFLLVKLKLSLRKFNCRCHNPTLFVFVDLLPLFVVRVTWRGRLVKQELLIILVFIGVCVAQYIFFFLLCSVLSTICLSFWLLYCLSFDLWLLTTPLISSIISYIIIKHICYRMSF